MSLTTDHRRFLNARGINDDSISAYGLASNGRSITIPVADKIRVYTPNGNPKIRWLEPLDDAVPPYPSWAALELCDLLVEGEFDCIVARQHGFEAVSGTTGAGHFSEDWADGIKGMVTILYDNDSAGRSGAIACANILRGRGVNVYIAHWPKDKRKGYDVTDFFVEGGTADELRALISTAVRYDPEATEGLKSLGEGSLWADLDTTPVITSGFQGIDEYIWGLRRGEVLVLAARPKVGKSTLAAQIAANVARRGLRTAIFSLEMSEPQILERLIASESNIDKTRLERGLGDTDVVKLYSNLQRIWNLPILISTENSLSPKNIARHARKASEKYPIDLIVVDYMQLMNVNDQKELRTRQLMAGMETLKDLAKELDCAMILLSQVNRQGAVGTEDSDGNGGKVRDEEPQIHQLYESGGIEAHADTVIILWRKRKEEKEAIENKYPIPTHGRVAKNRNGPEGYFHLLLDGPTFTFMEDAE